MTTKKPRRQYKDANGKRLPGVTTILGVLDKPALLHWAARTAAEATASAIVDGGMPSSAAVERGRLAPFQRRQEAADAGTMAHACVEAHYAGEPQPEDATPEAIACAQRVIRHIEGAGFVVVASEWASTHGLAGEGFAGTLDLVVTRATSPDEVDSSPRYWIADLKTGKHVVDEVVPQLAAYRWLWTQKTTLSPAAVASMMGGIVFHARVDGDAVDEVHLTPEKLDAGWRLFEAARAAYYARKDACLPSAKDDDDAA